MVSLVAATQRCHSINTLHQSSIAEHFYIVMLVIFKLAISQMEDDCKSSIWQTGHV